MFDGVDAGGFHSDDEDTHAGFEPVQEPEQQQEQQRKSRRGRRQSNQNDESDPVYWKLLDPHEPGNVKQKPFKKGTKVQQYSTSIALQVLKSTVELMNV